MENSLVNWVPLPYDAKTHETSESFVGQVAAYTFRKI